MADRSGNEKTPDGESATADYRAEKTTSTAQLDEETLAKVASVRTRILSTFGQVTLSMMSLPRYRHQNIADLTQLVLDPLIHDRIAVASPKAPENDPVNTGALAGIAIWATVSDEVDTKIREQVKAGVFPVRLKAEDWTSGKTIWLLDVIAPSQKLATAVLANFRQVAKEGKILIHPIVSRLVDPELLKELAAHTQSNSVN